MLQKPLLAGPNSSGALDRNTGRFYEAPNSTATKKGYSGTEKPSIQDFLCISLRKLQSLLEIALLHHWRVNNSPAKCRCFSKSTVCSCTDNFTNFTGAVEDLLKTASTTDGADHFSEFRYF
jgi:hypothetical protein